MYHKLMSLISAVIEIPKNLDAIERLDEEIIHGGFWLWVITITLLIFKCYGVTLW